MNYAEITGLLIAAVTFVLVTYDIWVKWKQPDGNATISWVLLQAAKHYPIIAFLIGGIMFHIFFQNCTVD